MNQTHKMERSIQFHRIYINLIPFALDFKLKFILESMVELFCHILKLICVLICEYFQKKKIYFDTI